MSKEEQNEKKDSIEDVLCDITDCLLELYVKIPMRYSLLLMNSWQKDWSKQWQQI